MNLAVNESVFDAFPRMESERLCLREFQLSDAEALFQLRSDDRVMQFMDTYSHKSIDDAVSMIKNNIESFNDKTGINWVIEDKSTGKMAGYFGFWRLMKEHVRAEIGYALLPEFWGKGIMTEAAREVLSFGFSTLQLHSVEANVNQKNLGSIRLLEKLGFKKEAHFRENYLFDGRFYDSIIYSLLETDIKLTSK